MTITTTVVISHDELHKLDLSDKTFKDLGYFLKRTDTQGKTYEKIAWQNAVPKDIKEL